MHQCVDLLIIIFFKGLIYFSIKYIFFKNNFYKLIIELGIFIFYFYFFLVDDVDLLACSYLTTCY